MLRPHEPKQFALGRRNPTNSRSVRPSFVTPECSTVSKALVAGGLSGRALFKRLQEMPARKATRQSVPKRSRFQEVRPVQPDLASVRSFLDYSKQERKRFVKQGVPLSDREAASIRSLPIASVLSLNPRGGKPLRAFYDIGCHKVISSYRSEYSVRTRKERQILKRLEQSYIGDNSRYSEQTARSIYYRVIPWLAEVLLDKEYRNRLANFAGKLRELIFSIRMSRGNFRDFKTIRIDFSRFRKAPQGSPGGLL